jgi:hypothetical protein
MYAETHAQPLPRHELHLTQALKYTAEVCRLRVAIEAGSCAINVTISTLLNPIFVVIKN